MEIANPLLESFGKPPKASPLLHPPPALPWWFFFFSILGATVVVGTLNQPLVEAATQWFQLGKTRQK